MPLEKIGFSKREQETFLYLLKGYKYKLIAEAMGVSDRTIECYVKNMRMKVGASSKQDLIRKVTRMVGWDIKNMGC